MHHYQKSEGFVELFIQEELVDSTDQPNVLVEFRDSISTQVEAGKVVTIIGYVRSRPVDTKSKGDRNRELYIVATGLESNDAARDFVVEPEYREAIEHWSSETSWMTRSKFSLNHMHPKSRVVTKSSMG